MPFLLTSLFRFHAGWRVIVVVGGLGRTGRRRGRQHFRGGAFQGARPGLSIFQIALIKESVLQHLRHESVEGFHGGFDVVLAGFGQLLLGFLVIGIDGVGARAANLLFRFLQFVGQIEDLSRRVFLVGEQAGRTQRVHPIFVPERFQQTSIETRLEVGEIERVVLLAVDAKVLDLVEGDGLVFGGRVIGGLVALGVGAKSADVDFAGGNGAHRIDNDGHPGVLKLLVQHLSGNVNAR